jgi:anti-anti-sigma regulatory factor
VHDAFSLPAELTIYTLGELHAICLAWMDAGAAAGSLRVDASAVAEVDAAGVQLLLSLSNALAARGADLELAAPSDTLRAACSALGTERLLATTEAQGALP